jgi:hypothetical protein
MLAVVDLNFGKQEDFITILHPRAKHNNKILPMNTGKLELEKK